MAKNSIVVYAGPDLRDDRRGDDEFAVINVGQLVVTLTKREDKSRKTVCKKRKEHDIVSKREEAEQARRQREKKIAEDKSQRICLLHRISLPVRKF